MVTIACVLRSGGDFLPAHVRRLASDVPGLVCLSDQPVDGVPVIPLAQGWPGWWSKMEMFGPSLAGDVFMMDLDTVVRRLPAMPDETTVLPDFYRPELMGSGFMFVTAADRARVWDAWITDPQAHMRRCTTRACWGDQGFLMPIIGHSARWGRNVVSYKLDCKAGVPDHADVICFHGKPRPWEVNGFNV